MPRLSNSRNSSRTPPGAPPLDAQAPPPRSAQWPNRLIRASAGTGKTYQLSGSYIARLRSSSPEHILAVTFTRAAAGEILERVLLRLAEAAAGGEKLAQLSQQVSRGDDQPLTPADCLARLKTLTHDLHRVRISTLDSFFIQLAQSFALELGLAPGWRILDGVEHDQLQTRAVERLFHRNSAADLRPLLNLLSKGDARRTFLHELRGTVRDFYEVFLSSDDHAWTRVPEPAPYSAERLREAIEALELARPHVPDLSTWQNAHRKAIAAAWDGDWETFLTSGLGASAAKGQQKFSRREIPPPLFEAYANLLPHARAVIVRQYAGRNRATRELLNRLDVELRALKKEQGGLTFSDVTHAVGEGWRRGAIERLDYRLDSSIEHLLLDEFQDTSIPQWQALEPLARRVAAAGHTSLFCVGDQKQAIYGWRGGVAELFDAVEQRLPHIEAEPLACSYRSSPAVIATVNRVFRNLHLHPKLEEAAPAIERWEARFDDHSTARTDAPGWVTLETPADAESTFPFAADRIVEIHGRIPSVSIGVLCKTNDAVAELARLVRRLGVEVSEEGRSRVDDSIAVRLLCSLLQFADHPGDAAARFHVCESPLGPIIGLPATDDLARLEPFAATLRRELLEQGYGACIERWAHALAPYCDPRGVARLRQVINLAHDYEAHATLRPRDFVQFLSANPALQAAPARVRIMTIHHSKGLEFDVVVLPELNQDALTRCPQFVAGGDDPVAPPDFVLRYCNKSVQGLLPDELQQVFKTNYEQRIEEQLCNLYVAITRARHALHLIVHPAANTPTLNWAGLLRAGLVASRVLPPQMRETIEGRPDWWKDLPSSQPPRRRTASIPQPAAPVVAPPRPDGLLAREIVRPSQHQQSGVRLAQLIRPQNAAALDRGALIHAWCEEIDWLDEGPPDVEALRRRARQLNLPSVDVEASLADFTRMLAAPDVARIFSSSACIDRNGSLSLPLAQAAPHATLTCVACRERRFVAPVDDTIVRGCIDRLVLVQEGQSVIAADVVDFKTDNLDQLSDAVVAERLADYRRQVQQYVRVVAHLYALPPERIGARLVFLSHGRVEPVTSHSSVST